MLFDTYDAKLSSNLNVIVDFDLSMFNATSFLSLRSLLDNHTNGSSALYCSILFRSIPNPVQDLSGIIQGVSRQSANGTVNLDTASA